MEKYSLEKKKNGYRYGKKILLIMIIVNCILFLNFELLTLYRKIWFVNIPLLIFILILKKNIDINAAKKMYFLLIYAICSIISILINQGGSGSVLNNIYSFLICIVLTQFTFSKRELKFILYAYILLNISWVSRASGQYEKVINQGLIDINPNIVACIILFSTMMISTLITELNYKYNKLFNIIFIIIAIISFINLESRGGLLSILVFLIFKCSILTNFRKQQKRLVKISIITIIVGILFPIIYLEMYKKGIDFKIPFIEKNLYSGREIIWKNFYMEFDKLTEYIFGLGSNIKILNNENVDLHNNYLAIICNFGVLGIISYIIFVVKSISDSCCFKNISLFKFNMLISFICVLVNGYFEATVYFSPIFMFMFIFLGIEKEEMEMEE